MAIYAHEITYQGLPCAALGAGKYSALLAPGIGSLLLRLRDEESGIDFFRFDESYPIEEVKRVPVLYGFSTLYLPNRLGDGKLITSDGIYRFPINEPEPLGNFIHGFLHLREHRLVSLSAFPDRSEAVTEYLFDEKDPMFEFFPLSFRLEVRYVLSEAGLEHFYTLHNLSKKNLPVGIGSHTAIKAPFADNGKTEDIRITMPVTKEILLNPRQLCTEETAVTERCSLYNDGTLNPAVEDINNQFFKADLPRDGLFCTTLEDTGSGKKIFYKTGREYPFWLVWNCGGNQGYFCPEPMTWMIDAPNLSLPSHESGYCEIAPQQSFTAYQSFSSQG